VLNREVVTQDTCENKLGIFLSHVKEENGKSECPRHCWKFFSLRGKLHGLQTDGRWQTTEKVGGNSAAAIVFTGPLGLPSWAN
jgi:hypothetical protein